MKGTEEKYDKELVQEREITSTTERRDEMPLRWVRN